MAQFVYPPLAVNTAGLATEAKQDDAITLLTSIDASTSDDNVVDFLDTGVLDTSSTNITAAGVTVVSSLAADVKEVLVIDDVGEFMVLTDGSDVILAYLPLGGGRVVVNIASGTALKLASVSGATISLGKITINFLG